MTSDPSSHRKAAQALADQARRARRRGEAADLARKALELDGECTDAQVLLAQEEAASPRELITRLKLIVGRAEAKLGAPFLREHRGRLWEVPEARPYLGSLLALATALEKAGRPGQAVPHLETLLASDPEDHLEARYRLVCCLLGAGELKKLAAFLKTREDGRSAFMAWAALLERIRSGSEQGAEQALRHARSVNPYVEDYLTGRRRQKASGGPAAPGSPEEAAETLRRFGETWSGDREGLYWLFRHG